MNLRIPSLFFTTISLIVFSLGFSEDLNSGSRPLTFDKALSITLQNHPNLQSSFIDKDKAENNLRLGNAGYLPKVDLVASANLLDTNLWAQNNNYKGTMAGVQASWVLFEGFKSPATWNRLSSEKEQAFLKHKINQNSIGLQVASLWIQNQKALSSVRITEEALKVSQERYKLSENRVNSGAAAGIELLQAKQDLASRQNDLSKAQLAVRQNQALLSQWIVSEKNASLTFQIDTALSPSASLESLLQKAQDQNPSLKYTQEALLGAKNAVSEAQAKFWPTVQLQGSYIFKPEGATPLNALTGKSSGPSLSILATWNIFDGFESTRLVSTAKLIQRSLLLAQKQLQSDLQLQIEQLWNSEQEARLRLQSELDNRELSRQILKSALERYQSGKGTVADLNSVQQSDLLAAERVLNVRLEILEASLKLTLLTQH